MENSKGNIQMMMESSGDHSFLRNRRLGNFLESNQGFRAEETKIPKPKEGVGLRSTSEAFVDDNSWSAVLISVFRIVMCFMTMMITTSIWAIVMVVLIPWPHQRIKQGNVYGHVTGRLLMWILGNPIKIEAAEFSDSKAIYICNHASPLDIFLVMWLAPTGTVGIAKKQIIWYPFFGQLYVLANHIRIDRSNRATAIESLKVASRFIIKYNLSLIIFPEGTRSQTGRLLPFKKGFIHLALQSKLPIVPIVLTGTHLAWRKNSLHLRPAPLTVKYLPPIKTDNWEAERIDEYVNMIHTLYIKHLPESQRPLPLQE